MKTKLIDRIRGSTPPIFATAKEWNEWEASAKSAHPFRFWLVETCFNSISTVFEYPASLYRRLKSYARYRWVYRMHTLTANPVDIKPGDWCDLSSRLLLCSFNALQEFVEIEMAHMQIVSFASSKSYTVVNYRCAQAGIDYLNESINNVWTDLETNDPSLIGKPTDNAIASQEILDLYTWWTTVYRNRPDPDDLSGFTVEFNKAFGGQDTFLLFSQGVSQAYRDASARSAEIETAYRNEDDLMLSRLIKVRHSLWT